MSVIFQKRWRALALTLGLISMVRKRRKLACGCMECSFFSSCMSQPGARCTFSSITHLGTQGTKHTWAHPQHTWTTSAIWLKHTRASDTGLRGPLTGCPQGLTTRDPTYTGLNGIHLNQSISAHAKRQRENIFKRNEPARLHSGVDVTISLVEALSGTCEEAKGKKAVKKIN